MNFELNIGQYNTKLYFKLNTATLAYNARYVFNAEVVTFHLIFNHFFLIKTSSEIQLCFEK